MNEHELTALLERTSSGLEPDVDALVAAGAAAGRRRLWRKRGAVAVAAVAIGGVVVAGGVVLTGGSGEGHGLDVAGPTASQARGIDTDGDGVADASVTARLRTVEEMHREVRRILGEEAGPVLGRSYGPIVRGASDADPHGTDVAWWFRYEGTLTQVNVHATSQTCAGYEDVFVDPPDCSTHGGVEVAVHEPERTSSAYREISRPVEGWQEGYVVRIIATNSDERGPEHRGRVVTDGPPIPLESMIDLVTSEIWFEDQPG